MRLVHSLLKELIYRAAALKIAQSASVFVSVSVPETASVSDTAASVAGEITAATNKLAECERNSSPTCTHHSRYTTHTIHECNVWQVGATGAEQKIDGGV